MAIRAARVTCLGVEWLAMALLVPMPWSQRVWALPFLTLLMPSEQADTAAGRRHRTTVEWTRVMVRLVVRWLGRRPWILIGDGRYACIHLGWECLTNQATLISRLRLDARLFADPKPVPAGRRGPKPKKGDVLAKLVTREEAARSRGEEVAIQWGPRPRAPAHTSSASSSERWPAARSTSP
ncbi:transposase [Thiocapsa roseopersicina]|uniref:transposase n=1 Tax=Thiocapsa roseopersicina TaxID=1058 RepID=UPI001587F49F|nr:transposase [Thiocapsa roseopersicina]